MNEHMFVPATRPLAEIREVQRLLAQGLNHREVSARTGVPLSTIRTWLYQRLPAMARADAVAACPRCGAEAHSFSGLPREIYAYLLGLYLGDGCISRIKGRSHVLRISLDCAYPGIIDEADEAIATIRGRPAWRGVRPAGKNCVNLTSYWREWPCLFPQHGPGRKHHRPIELVDWQREIVEADPRPLLRGLIQSDGWRGLNRVFVKGKWYAYPRYQFSNRSDDIRRIFTDACDLLGVEWRPWTRWHISVARRDSVATLDEFVGPKS